MQESKTIVEIFKENYTPFSITSNFYIASEAKGYIIATLTYFPWLSKDLTPYLTLCNWVIEEKPLLTDNEWQEIRALDVLTLEEALSIIEDATSHGFTFKIENGKLYYQES